MAQESTYDRVVKLETNISKRIDRKVENMEKRLKRIEEMVGQLLKNQKQD